MSIPFGFGYTAKTAGLDPKLRPPRLVPPFWQLLGFSVFFGAGGYMIEQGDVLNGSGVLSAWSLTYVTFATLPALRHMHRSPLSMLLSASVVGMGLGIYANYYFDKASWRGAIPGLLPKPKASSPDHESKGILHV